MSEQIEAGKEFALENVITTAVQIPGVKVDRKEFLAKIFASEDVIIQDILEFGPIKANVSQELLSELAQKHIIKRTSQSSIASFITGMPGGLAIAATIPADLLQFFGMALRLAQELSYLYGAGDLWQGDEIDDEKVRDQLLLYCGVMFGVSGAVSGVRVLTSQITKTTLKKIPQKALTKTFWYPILKKIGRAIGVKITKTTFAKGVSKAIPIVGGVISGGLNFASMLPMANRLHDTLENACFNYSEEDFEKDIDIIENTSDVDDDEEEQDFKTKIIDGGKKIGENISGWIDKVKSSRDNNDKSSEDIVETLKKLAELKDLGIVTQEEFETKKAELLSKM